MEQGDLVWLAIASLVVSLTYIYPAWRSVGLFVEDKSLRGLRAAFLNVMMVVGLTRITATGFQRAYPDIQWLGNLNTIVAPLLTIMLLTGGIFLTVLWKIDDFRKAKDAGEHSSSH